MSFQLGEFDRSQSGFLRKFSPMLAVRSLPEVDLDRLWDLGKRLILLDVDHTIVKWHEEEFSTEVLAWLARAKEMGFQLRILSNTRHPQRLARLSAKIDIPTKNGKFKPSPEMYKEALSETGFGADQTVMIGDQIMTDVLGANRTGIDAIWLQKMEGPEFFGTKFNRVIERIIMSVLYRTMVTSTPDAATGTVPLFERPVVRQFAKFLMVGAVSFLIDNGIRFLLMFFLKSGGASLSEEVGRWLRETAPAVFKFAKSNAEAFYPVTAVIGSFVATFNSYLMNRKFTFGIQDKEDAGKQLVKVFMVNYVGLAINVLISSYFFTVIPGHPKRSAAVAGVLGAGVAAFWNFAGQRYFAFKVHKRS